MIFKLAVMYFYDSTKHWAQNGFNKLPEQVKLEENQNICKLIISHKTFLTEGAWYIPYRIFQLNNCNSFKQTQIN